MKKTCCREDVKLTFGEEGNYVCNCKGSFTYIARWTGQMVVAKYVSVYNYFFSPRWVFKIYPFFNSCFDVLRFVVWNKIPVVFPCFYYPFLSFIHQVFSQGFIYGVGSCGCNRFIRHCVRFFVLWDSCVR